MRSPRLLSHAKLLQGWMIFDGGGGSVPNSGRRSSGVQTLLNRFALTCSQLFDGICSSSGSSGLLNTYGGGDCAVAMPAEMPTVSANSSARSTRCGKNDRTIEPRKYGGDRARPEARSGADRANACDAKNDRYCER